MRTIGALGLACLCAAVLAGGALADGSSSGILISSTNGKIYEYRFATDSVTEIHAFAETGNFDIQYQLPNQQEMVIANLVQGRIERFDRSTGQLTTLSADPALNGPIGVAVGRRGVYYVAGHDGSVAALDSGSGTVDILATQGPDFDGEPDGIVLDRRGNVVFTTHAGRVYRIDPSDGSIEMLADIAGARLNGVVLDRHGDLIIAAHDGMLGPAGAIYHVDSESGAVSTLYEGLPLRSPEDVAVDSAGNVYVIDSDFQDEFGDHNAALYVLRPDGSLDLLADGLEGDVVDILLTR